MYPTRGHQRIIWMRRGGASRTVKGVDTASCLDTAAHIVSASTAEGIPQGKHKVFVGRVLFVGLML